MESDCNDDCEQSVSEAEKTDDVSFYDVSAVASEWMLDFLFISLCRLFKEGDLDKYEETLSVLQAISHGDFQQGAVHKEKILICAFLTRVMYGKMLDVQFDEDDHLMPLMSAAKVWWDLKHAVDDESLFNSIEILLLVQSVAVCLEKGQNSSASFALKWFENTNKCPKSLKVKLSSVVKNMETYDSLLMGFSFNRLLEMVQAYLDTYLKKNPSDYLLKAATEVVKSSKNRTCLEDVVSQDSNATESSTTTDQKIKKTKRKLLPTANSTFCTPDAPKSPHVSIRRLSRCELSQMTASKPLKTSEVTSRENKKSKKRKKWTSQLDKYLKKGVEVHGVGKWSLILKDYDFEGRTGVMLKDRWRTLVKTNVV